VSAHRSDETEKIYDAVAREYAQAFHAEHERKPKDREILRRFSSEIGSREPVWDLGCGPGQVARYLKDLAVHVSGLDLSVRMLEEARAAHPDIHFRRGNILDLEFADDSLAGAVAFYAMVHFTKEQVKHAFCEIFRVLQPDGIFLFTFHIGSETIHLDEFLGKRIDIDFRFFPTDFMIGCLRNRGFEKIEIIERDPYPGVEFQSRRAYVFCRKPVPES